ncbi:SprT-like domain-containing protein [Shimazuella kribbensis]|uniref:SprT-like domain-containing protein n=1 Tax=Shimazuella kribbensis TaxID=139808 RepID=UPI000402B539|nr:SprT-like domain-containing protein [Shimazuella kribbensis]
MTQIANDFLQEGYELYLNIPIQLNGRLSRTLGRAVFRKKQYEGTKAVRIELSKKLIFNYTEVELIDVLKHELVHYACFMIEKPYDDGVPYFEKELKKLGVVKTGVMKLKGKTHVYVSEHCQNTIAESARRFKTQ